MRELFKLCSREREAEAERRRSRFTHEAGNLDARFFIEGQSTFDLFGREQEPREHADVRAWVEAERL